MKCACLVAAAALAGAVAPPTISLNLEGDTGATQLDSPIVRDHDLGLTQNDGTPVSSRQDWTEKCAAGGSTEQNCPFPIAKAYDHHEGEGIDVECRLFLVDQSGQTITTPEQKSDCSRTSVDFTKRSTYLFKYDASDSAGNHAEQVVFALVLNDLEAPVFDADKCSDAIEVEAASDWTLCSETAYDNIDGDRTSNIEYRIQSTVDESSTFDEMPSGVWGTYEEAKAHFTPQDGSAVCDAQSNCGPVELGKFLITARVSDAAGMYGHQEANNLSENHVVVDVKDTRKPVIQIAGVSPARHECISAANFKGVQADASQVCASPDTTEGQCGFNYVDEGADSIAYLDQWALKKTDKHYDAHCIDCPEVEATSDAARVYSKDNISSELGTNEVGTTLTQTTFFNELADTEQTKTRTIQYTSANQRGLESDPVTRAVTTVDSIAPTFTLHTPRIVDRYEGFYEKNDKYHHKSDSSHGDDMDAILADIDPDSSISTFDWCDDDHSTITKSWGPKEFNARAVGEYVRTYTATDRRGNSETATRTFNIVDPEAPTINVIYSDPSHEVTPQTFEATRDEEYTDQGATCNDYVDGELSHAVQVAGEVVNMRVPGSYVISYDCSDLSGNPAATKMRTIVVEDTTCPTISVITKALEYVEAGFPYDDSSTSATDSLDGDISEYIWTDGDVVNVKQAFFARRDCAEIREACSATGETCGSGEYFITTERDVNGEQRTHRQQVHCWMEPQTPVTFKIFQLPDCEEQNELRGWDLGTSCHLQNGCELLGMVRNTNVSPQLQTYINTVYPTVTFHGDYSDTLTLIDGEVALKDKANKEFFGDSTYVCQAADIVTEKFYGDNVESNDEKAAAAAHAEQGTYVIQYHVADKAGNQECDPVVRTVLVRDTLPPVITVTLGDKLIHISKGDQKGLDDETNPAGPVGTQNPNLEGVTFQGTVLMAEAAASNGWLMGAVASATVGVALLTYGSRKTSAVSVPV